jgi:EF-hand domain
MAAAIKMDELLVSWLGNDTVWEEVLSLVEKYRSKDETIEKEPTKRGMIPPFYQPRTSQKPRRWKNVPLTEVLPWNSVKDSVIGIMNDLQVASLSRHDFARITKEICHFPTFFTGPLFRRISPTGDSIAIEGFQNFYEKEIEPYDAAERFFRLVKSPSLNYIGREDFLPFIQELLNDHPVS